MKINIVGLGPGHPDYITPAAAEVIKKSDVIIAGKRNLESIDTSGKETVEISSGLSELADYIKQNYAKKRIVIAATGDPCFYGILGFMKRNFDDSDFAVIPGISSFQYLSAKLNLPWENAYLGSFHGREDDVVSAARTHERSVFLTDSRRTYRYIAEMLCDAGIGHCKMIIGVNLSYQDEIIIKTTAQAASSMKTVYDLCTVVVLNEK